MKQWAKPIDADRFHIFEDGVSLCGSIHFEPDDVDSIATLNDTFHENEDCKTCYQEFHSERGDHVERR